jgi:hypothetical protein
MKTLLTGLVSVLFLNSCVFEFPFETEAKIPVETKLLGRWEEVPDKPDDKANQMLVIQHSANEYVVEYPVGDEATYFRAFAVELAGGKYIQIQLIGSADKPVEAADRKYHLLKVGVDGDASEMRTIDEDILGKDLAGTAQMKAAFAEHKDDPKLFADPAKFRRVK